MTPAEVWSQSGSPLLGPQRDGFRLTFSGIEPQPPLPPEPLLGPWVEETGPRLCPQKAPRRRSGWFHHGAERTGHGTGELGSSPRGGGRASTGRQREAESPPLQGQPTAKTSRHQPGGSQQLEFTSHSPGGQESEIRVSTGQLPGRGPSSPLLVPGDSRASLACGHIASISASIFTRHSPLCFLFLCLL